jgi:hypothetical protein
MMPLLPQNDLANERQRHSAGEPFSLVCYVVPWGPSACDPLVHFVAICLMLSDGFGYVCLWVCRAHEEEERLLHRILSGQGNSLSAAIG